MSVSRWLPSAALAAGLLAAAGSRAETPGPQSRPPEQGLAAAQGSTGARGAATAAPATAPARAAPAARAAPRPVTWSEPERARVTPGILVRAAKRAQQREGAACSPCAARSDANGAVESIEIDWHAATAAP